MRISLHSGTMISEKAGKQMQWELARCCLDGSRYFAKCVGNGVCLTHT